MKIRHSWALYLRENTLIVSPAGPAFSDQTNEKKKKKRTKKESNVVVLRCWAFHCHSGSGQNWDKFASDWTRTRRTDQDYVVGRFAWGDTGIVEDIVEKLFQSGWKIRLKSGKIWNKKKRCPTLIETTAEWVFIYFFVIFFLKINVNYPK